MNQTKAPKDIAIALLLVGLFLLIVALLSLEEEPVEIRKAVIPNADVNVLDLVNKHMREIYDKQEMERKNVENINALTAPPISQVKPEVPAFHFEELPLIFEEESANELVGQDLRSYASSAINSRPLNQQIQHEIIQDLKRAAEEEIYKKALAEAIISKARSQGYDLQIDEDYKIKSIRKVKFKEAPSVFDQTGLPNR